MQNSQLLERINELEGELEVKARLLEKTLEELHRIRDERSDALYKLEKIEEVLNASY